MLQANLAGLPLFAVYLATGVALTAAFAAAYVALTPYNEMRLIREGNAAAATALLGAILGFALPLTTAMRLNGDMGGFLIWTVIAAVVQLAAFLVARAAVPSCTQGVAKGEIASGIWLGGIALAFGMVNAASMTP